ncbi:MAG: hypothetical protein RL562_900 [Planctomycetota bacterium]|jgi:hypothetical protein
MEGSAPGRRGPSGRTWATGDEGYPEISRPADFQVLVTTTVVPDRDSDAFAARV